MDRRRFLEQLAASPWILGLGELLAQDREPDSDWLKTALEDHKTKGRDAVIVVLPIDLPTRARLGRALWKLIKSGPPFAHALFMETDFIFLSPSLAAQHIPLDVTVGDRLLLDPNGEVVASASGDFKAFTTPEEFVRSFGPFLRGEHLERLRARNELTRERLPRAVVRALGDLKDDRLVVHICATDLLRQNLGSALPCLLYEAASTESSEVRTRALELIETPFRSVFQYSWRDLDENLTHPRSPLPYGIERSRQYHDPLGGGCGSLVVEEPPEGEPPPRIDHSRGPMVCGMVGIGEITRTFVRFLSK
jgi:hypothetical protein